jgi:hypothetical protein
MTGRVVGQDLIVDLRRDGQGLSDVRVLSKAEWSMKT